MNDFFDKIYCINLVARKDRREHAEAVFKAYNLDVEFIDAVDGKKCGIKPKAPPANFTQINQGELGCLLSHQMTINCGIDEDAESILILEDDVEFGDIAKIQEYLDIVPKNWEMLYFGGNHIHPTTPIDNRVARCNFTVSAHAIGLRKNILPSLSKLMNGINLPCDIIYGTLQKIYTAYTSRTSLAWQIESFSDINNRVTDYTILK